MSPISVRARELHAKHHADRPYVTCSDCRVAATALINGRTRPARSIRSGETVAHKRADELSAEDVGRIVFTLGNRGYLRSATPEEKGVHVATTTGVAVYDADVPFAVWGP